MSEAPAILHTKSAPAPPLAKLQPYAGLIIGAEKSLQAAFSGWGDDDDDDEKERKGSISGSLAKVRLGRQIGEEEAGESGQKFKGLLERVANPKRKGHGVSFAPGVLDKKKPAVGGLALGAPAMTAPGPAGRRLLKRSQRLKLLDTTVEEEEDEDRDDDSSSQQQQLQQHRLSASSPSGMAITIDDAHSNRSSFSGTAPPASPPPDDAAADSPPAAASSFSFFKLKKPALSLSLTPRETAEDEEATIDVFDGTSAENAVASHPRRLPTLALGEEEDEGDGGGSEFDPRETYSISSGGTLNLAQFKINSQGLVSGSHGGVASSSGRQSAWEKGGGGGEEEEGGIVMLADQPELSSDNAAAAAALPSSSAQPAAASEVVEITLRKEDLVEIGVCGKGQNGVVRKAIHLLTLTRLALKTHVIYDKGTRHQLLHELTAYTKLQSPYLVSFLGAYHDSGSIIMATEYMELGSLQSFQRKKKEQLTVRVVCDIVYKALHGLHFLHSNHQVHRDVKPDNFLVNRKGEVKVCDFGLIRELSDTHAVTDTFLGTLAYLSPERLMSNHYSYAADIWALGLTVVFLLTGSLGMDTTDYWQMVANINSLPQLDPELYGAECVAFVNCCLEKEPDMRATAEQLLDTDWMRQREDTSADPIWEADTDDLDVILDVLIDRHLMPSVDLPMPALITQHSAPVMMTLTADGAGGTDIAMPHPSRFSSSPMSTSSVETKSSPSPTSASPPVDSIPAAAFSTTVSVAEAEGSAVTGDSEGSGEQPHSTVVLHVDVDAADVHQHHRSSISLPSSSSSSSSSSYSPLPGEGSPCTPSSSSSASTAALQQEQFISYAVLDPERAAALADQFGISEAIVQERFSALWLKRSPTTQREGTGSPETNSSRNTAATPSIQSAGAGADAAGGT